MSRAKKRPPLTRQRFDAALKEAEISVSPDDGDAIFDTAAWLDTGLAMLAGDRDRAQTQ